MANPNTTARSGKTETLNEVLIRLGYLKPETPATQDEQLAAILTRVQRMLIRRTDATKPCPLMIEHWDWLVVLQCMQDHNLFKSNPKRPPLGAFVLWLQEQHIPQYLAHASVYELSLASRALRNARYPWTGVMWDPNVLKRWRLLYRQLSTMFSQFSCDTETIS